MPIEPVYENVLPSLVDTPWSVDAASLRRRPGHPEAAMAPLEAVYQRLDAEANRRITVKHILSEPGSVRAVSSMENR